MEFLPNLIAKEVGSGIRMSCMENVEKLISGWGEIFKSIRHQRASWLITSLLNFCWNQQKIFLVSRIHMGHMTKKIAPSMSIFCQGVCKFELHSICRTGNSRWCMLVELWHYNVTWLPQFRSLNTRSDIWLNIFLYRNQKRQNSNCVIKPDPD